jgi:hypothetical protein
MSKLAAFAAALGLATALLVGAGTASSAPKPHGSPVRFLARIVRLLAANRYAEAWKWLDPADQKLAPEPVYVACESLSPVPGRLVSLHPLHVGRDRLGVAVRFRLEIAEDGIPQVTTVVLAAHAVVAGRRWAWILPPARRALYRQGCGLGSPAP